jgi:hypothetical protein
MILNSFILKCSVLWDIMCNLLKVTWRFGGTCHLHLQGGRLSHARNQPKAGSKQSSWLAEIPVFIGTRRETQGNKSVPGGLPIRQNEPVRVQEQLPSCHWLCHTTEGTSRRWDQDNQPQILHSIILLCKFVIQRLRLALVQNMQEHAVRGPPCPQCCICLPPALSARVSCLEEVIRQHWPTSSAKRMNCHICSARRKIGGIITQCKKCDIALCILGCFGTTTPRLESDCTGVMTIVT